jgi:endonuclease I
MTIMNMMRPASLITFLLASSAVLAQDVTTTAVEQKYDDCDVATYYGGMPADVSSWDEEMLHALLFSSHRNTVNLTNNIDPGIEDVWGALMDVDSGEEPGTVHLVYSDKEIPKEPFGQRGWVRDHLFPILRGVGIAGIDLTDIHNIRAATPLSNIVSADKYFGECQHLTQPESCVAPAEGASEDSCACNRVFTPPATMKGDIARALMYMDLRYDGAETFTRNLRLTDCPFQPERDMAYLSQMLTWHMEDPPDAREISRNNKVCANWQGNRNPFVDFPELATTFFPPISPLPGVGEGLIYEKCEALPTLAPTFESNSCDLYEEGDFVVWLLNSDKPLSLGLYSFAPMEEGFELFITDNPWNGEEFMEQEVDFDGTLKVRTMNYYIQRTQYLLTIDDGFLTVCCLISFLSFFVSN